MELVVSSSECQMQQPKNCVICVVAEAPCFEGWKA